MYMMESNKRIKKALNIVVLHVTVIPVAILIAGGVFNTYDYMYMISILGISVLWSWIVGGIYMKKFNKIKKGDVDKKG